MGERRGSRFPVVRLVVGELVLFAIFYFSGPVLGTVPLAHFGVWLRQSAPADAFTALVRLGGLIVSSWLLFTTAVYVLGKLAGIRSLVRGSSWATLPFVRRVVDGVAAASILAATVAASTGIASAAPVRQPAHTRVVRAPVPEREEAEAPKAKPVVTSTAHVNRQVVGRHLPHPGVIAHNVPVRLVSAPNPAAPNPGNGFAGLAPGTKVVLVQPGDCLSVLAQRHLGSWQRYHEIAALNMGRAQADGGSLQQEHWIYPQWVLVMPADAVGTLVVGAPAAPASVDPPAAAATAPLTPAATSGVAAVTQAPAAAAGGGQGSVSAAGGAVAATSSSGGAQTGRAPVVATTTPATTPATTAATTTPAATGPVIPPSVHNGVGRGPTVVTGPGVASGGQGSGPATVPAGSRKAGSAVIGIPVADMAGAGLAVVGFLLLLGKLRKGAAARRRRGERAPRPTGQQALVELAARVVSDDAMVEFLDAGLRLLTEGLSVAEFVAPAIIGAEVHSDRLVIVLDEPAEGVPDGFEAGEDAAEWVLWYPETAAEFDGLVASVAHVTPALPSLVALGRDGDGNVTVLVNLEAVGVVSLSGDEVLAAEIVASVAVELATSPWSQLCRVVLVGMGRPDGLGLAEPVELYRDLGECLEQLSTYAAGVRRAANDHEVGSLAELRIGAGMGDVGPVVVLCAEEPAAGQLEELAALAGDPACGLAGVVVAGGLAGKWALELSDGFLEVGPLGRRLVPQRLSVSMLDTMEGSLSVAAAEPVPAAARGAEVDDGDDGGRDWFVAAGGSAADADADADEDQRADDAVHLDLVAAGSDLEEEDGAAGEVADEDGGAVDRPEDPVVDEVLRALDAAEGDGARRDGVADQEVEEAVRPPRLTVVPGAPLPIEELVKQILAVLPDVDQAPDLFVGVLGPEPRLVRLTGPDAGPIQLARKPSLEAVVYVSLKAEPVYHTKVQEVMYPAQAGRGELNPTSFNTTMSAARKSLGFDRYGNPCLGYKTKEGGKFGMSAGVTTDWYLFRRLLAAAETPAPKQRKIRLLALALALLGDEGPFAEIFRQQQQQNKRPAAVRNANKHWAWLDAEQILSEMQAEVVDAATWLAKLLTQEGDGNGARLALQKGFMVTHANNSLWCQAMDLAVSEGNWMALELIREAWERVEAEMEPYGNFDGLRAHYHQLLQQGVLQHA